MKDNLLTTLVMPLSIFFIMVGLGLNLRITDFTRIIKYPKAIFIGLFNQLVLLPIIGYIICILFFPEPLMCVGIMLLAACPGGATSNLITHVSKGDIALSISLTAFSSFLTIFSIPIILSWSLLHFLGESQVIELPIIQTIGRIFTITLLPAIIGMMIRYYRPIFAQKMDRPSRIASTIIYSAIILGIIYANKDNLVQELMNIGPSVVTLNLSTMLLGFIIASIFSLSVKQKISISIESGIQNGTLAIVIAASILGNIDMGIPAAVYGLAMFASGGMMMFGFGRRNIEKENKRTI
jgi:BASS family bile acid:Na+ symporter